MMESQALDAFGALAQETRLRIVRLLVRAGPGGLSAGAVAVRVGVPASTLSFHLGHLERAGLVRSRRDARSIVYSADVAAFAGLLQFLMEDCCAGSPEICAPAIEALSPPDREPSPWT
jgi:DNA-binding transcriptional ArsR family regulator